MRKEIGNKFWQIQFSIDCLRMFLNRSNSLKSMVALHYTPPRTARLKEIDIASVGKDKEQLECLNNKLI